LIGWANQYSFIADISVAPIQVHYYSEALPTTALICFAFSAFGPWQWTRPTIDWPHKLLIN